MTGVLGCLFKRNMVIGLKMAALGDGTDPLSHSPLFQTDGLNQECEFCQPPSEQQKDLTHYQLVLSLSFFCSVTCCSVIESV